MRLSESESHAIIESLKRFVPTEFKGHLLLFGSRTLDQAKGGDIDLALIGDLDLQILELKKVDYKIVAAMKVHKSIGDRKIDFKILNRADSQSAFFQHALKNAKLLFTW